MEKLNVMQGSIENCSICKNSKTRNFLITPKNYDQIFGYLGPCQNIRDTKSNKKEYIKNKKHVKSSISKLNKMFENEKPQKWIPINKYDKMKYEETDSDYADIKYHHKKPDSHDLKRIKNVLVDGADSDISVDMSTKINKSKILRKIMSTASSKTDFKTIVNHLYESLESLSKHSKKKKKTYNISFVKPEYHVKKRLQHENKIHKIGLEEAIKIMKKKESQCFICMDQRRHFDDIFFNKIDE